MACRFLNPPTPYHQCVPDEFEPRYDPPPFFAHGPPPPPFFAHGPSPPSFAGSERSCGHAHGPGPARARDDFPFLNFGLGGEFGHHGPPMPLNPHERFDFRHHHRGREGCGRGRGGHFGGRGGHHGGRRGHCGGRHFGGVHGHHGEGHGHRHSFGFEFFETDDDEDGGRTHMCERHHSHPHHHGDRSRKTRASQDGKNDGQPDADSKTAGEAEPAVHIRTRHHGPHFSRFHPYFDPPCSDRGSEFANAPRHGHHYWACQCGSRFADGSHAAADGSGSKHKKPETKGKGREVDSSDDEAGKEKRSGMVRQSQTADSD